jgi:hypothetical protein
MPFSKRRFDSRAKSRSAATRFCCSATSLAFSAEPVSASLVSRKALVFLPVLYVLVFGGDKDVAPEPAPQAT